jgi:hypothetical protein
VTKTVAGLMAEDPRIFRNFGGGRRQPACRVDSASPVQTHGGRGGAHSVSDTVTSRGRKLVYCEDPSLAKWFEEADTLALRDQERELCIVMTWLIHTHREAARLLEYQDDLDLAFQELIGCAHCVAAAEVIAAGEVNEVIMIHRAMELAPALMKKLYVDLLKGTRTAHCD